MGRLNRHGGMSNTTQGSWSFSSTCDQWEVHPGDCERPAVWDCEYSVEAQHDDGRRYYTEKGFAPRSRTERANGEAEAKAKRLATRLEKQGFDPTTSKDWSQGESVYGSETWEDSPARAFYSR
jgi:hypothetical protein